MRNGARANTVATLGFFLNSLDLLVVSIALPTIEADLGGGALGQQWILNSFTVMFASFLLFAGHLADRIGAKQAMI